MAATPHGYHIPGTSMYGVQVGDPANRCGGPRWCDHCKDSVNTHNKGLIVMLKIEKWTPINTTVDVVEFKGGEDHAYQIIEWIIDNGSLGLYSPARKEADLEIYGEEIHIDHADEEIIIEKDGRFCKALPGMCVLRDVDNTFYAVTKEDLIRVFKPGKKED